MQEILVVIISLLTHQRLYSFFNINSILLKTILYQDYHWLVLKITTWGNGLIFIFRNYYFNHHRLIVCHIIVGLNNVILP